MHTYCVHSVVGNPGGTTGVLVFQVVEGDGDAITFIVMRDN